jgi:hypothetical protein
LKARGKDGSAQLAKKRTAVDFIENTALHCCRLYVLTVTSVKRFYMLLLEK